MGRMMSWMGHDGDPMPQTCPMNGRGQRMMRTHRAECNDLLLAVGKQILELPDLVAAVGRMDSSVILDPQILSEIRELPHRGGQ